MNKSIQNLSMILFVGVFLNACDGDVLFRTKPCEDGMVREGSTCVSESLTKISDKTCKDVDLNKVHKGETVTMCDRSIGEGKYVPSSSEIPACSKEGDKNCTLTSPFVAMDPSKLDATKIAMGTTILGVAGSLRASKQCRNYSALATFDSSYPPSNSGWNWITFLPAAVNTGTDQITFTNPHGLITNAPVRFSTTTALPAPLVAGTTYYAIYISNSVIQLASVSNGTQIDLTTQGTGTHTAHDVADSTAQYFDTIDDRNNDLGFSPANNPWSSSDYLCDASNFVNVTSTSSPFLPSGLVPATGNQTFTQIWQDQISGTYISNILSVSGGRHWSDAIRTCESLNGGTAGNGWRLPSQKELLEFYLHGIAKIAIAPGGVNNQGYWSSSGDSSNPVSAWIVFLSNGYTMPNTRSNTANSALCVR